MSIVPIPLLVDMANSLLEDGFKLFPLGSNSKKPLPGSRGFKDASSDPKQIAAWLALHKNCNLGLLTGNGLLVVDVDGDQGLASLKTLPDLPETFTVCTPGGGRHLYFDVGDQPAPTTTSSLAPSIDTRGEGGYVVTPGSMIDGKPYWVERETAIAEAPGWLLSKLTTPKIAHVQKAVLPLSQHAGAKALMDFLKTEDEKRNGKLTYDVWVKVGMALYHECVEDGVEVWRAWGDPEDADFTAKWASFATDGSRASFNSLRRMALDWGWLPSIPAAELTLHTAREIFLKSLNIVGAYTLSGPKLTGKGNISSTQPLTARGVENILEQVGPTFEHDTFFDRMIVTCEDPEAQKAVDWLLEHQPEAIEEYLWGHVVSVGFPGGGIRQFIHYLRRGMNKTNALDDWRETLPVWDGTERIEAMAATLNDHPRTALYVRRFLIQMIQATNNWRDAKPIGNALVLCGSQGIGKTTWLSRLVPEGWYADGVSVDLGGAHSRREIKKELQGVLLAELGEIGQTLRRNDADALKRYLTSPKDTFRQMYTAGYETHPRQVVFCGSVNTTDFLSDSTGNRRFWPIEVKDCFYEAWSEGEMRQLWAEAKAAWVAGAHWDLIGSEIVQHEAYIENFHAISPCAEALNARVTGKGDLYWLTTTQLAGMVNINVNAAVGAAVKMWCETRGYERRDRVRRGTDSEPLRKVYAVPIDITDLFMLEATRNIPLTRLKV